MIRKDLRSISADRWSGYLTFVTELSKSDPDRPPLVKSDVQMYDFDSICANLFPRKKVPTSADGLEITSRSIRFVEFKSGFRKNISKRNFVEGYARCEVTGEVCEKYWSEFCKNRKKETSELIDSIRLKALESYFTLEKQLLPLCKDAPERVSVIFTAVIDGEPTEGILDALAGPAGRKRPVGTSVQKVETALKRLIEVPGPNKSVYFYDKIEVFSAQDYENQLRQRSR